MFILQELVLDNETALYMEDAIKTCSVTITIVSNRYMCLLNGES